MEMKELIWSPKVPTKVFTFARQSKLVFIPDFEKAFFLISNKGVIVVDCPPTIGHGVLYAIGNTTNIPVTHVVYSHHHGDHISGVTVFGDKVKTISHIETARYLEKTPDPARPVPKFTFKDHYTISLGNQTLELAYRGENHVHGNIFIYAPIQKVLMLVDVVYPGWTPFANLGETKYVPGLMHSIDQILRYDFDHYIGGHVGKTGNRTDVLVQQEYMNDLKRNCEYAINLGQTNDALYGVAALLGPTAAKNPGNTWAPFKVYLDTLATLCANMTNEKWLGKLAAADVFQFENALTMIESLRIDFGVLGPFVTV
jgi:glyoxylase-like metal-dependent hydrolase (beta-lactamase superfamily II)